MKHILVGIPNSHRLASEIGKVGSKNGITFYDRKSEGFIIVSMVPSDFESKATYLAEVISLAKTNILDTEEIGRLFGESAVGAELMGSRLLITENADASSMLTKAGIKHTQVKKESIIETLKSAGAAEAGLPARIQIDKSFNVKGIGTVLLGIITSGMLHKHDQLMTPDGKQVIIRSIQVQDDDVEATGEGARIGIAIKGADEYEFEKGDVLAPNPIDKVGRLKASISVSKLAGDRTLDYKEMWLVSGFRSSLCKVSEDTGGSVTILLSTKLPLESGEKFLLVRNAAPRIFAGGTILEVSPK